MHPDIVKDNDCKEKNIRQLFHLVEVLTKCSLLQSILENINLQN